MTTENEQLTNLKNLMKLLANHKISTSMIYDHEKDKCFVDLQTIAKSHLYVYEDGIIGGRYDYESGIDLTKNDVTLLFELCLEFRDALHGRNYGQQAWFDLCKSKGITINFQTLHN